MEELREESKACKIAVSDQSKVCMKTVRFYSVNAQVVRNS